MAELPIIQIILLEKCSEISSKNQIILSFRNLFVIKNSLT